MGIISAKDGASMTCTNEVFNRISRDSVVFDDGSLRASSSIGEIAIKKRRGIYRKRKEIIIFI